MLGVTVEAFPPGVGVRLEAIVVEIDGTLLAWDAGVFHFDCEAERLGAPPECAVRRRVDFENGVPVAAILRRRPFPEAIQTPPATKNFSHEAENVPVPLL